MTPPSMVPRRTKIVLTLCIALTGVNAFLVYRTQVNINLTQANLDEGATLIAQLRQACTGQPVFLRW